MCGICVCMICMHGSQDKSPAGADGAQWAILFRMDQVASNSNEKNMGKSWNIKSRSLTLSLSLSLSSSSYNITVYVYMCILYISVVSNVSSLQFHLHLGNTSTCRSLATDQVLLQGVPGPTTGSSVPQGVPLRARCGILVLCNTILCKLLGHLGRPWTIQGLHCLSLSKMRWPWRHGHWMGKHPVFTA